MVTSKEQPCPVCDYLPCICDRRKPEHLLEGLDTDPRPTDPKARRVWRSRAFHTKEGLRAMVADPNMDELEDVPQELLDGTVAPLTPRHLPEGGRWEDGEMVDGKDAVPETCRHGNVVPDPDCGCGC